MTVYRNRAFRIQASVFVSLGVFGFVDGTPVTLALLTLAALISAVLLPALIAEPSLVPVKVQPYVEVTR